jgi:hypothetical protein
MDQTSLQRFKLRRRLRYPLRVGVGVLGSSGVAAVYVWGIASGEATVVTAATAFLVFAGGEYYRRRLAAQQYRWDKIAPQYEAFLRHLRQVTRAEGNAREKLQAKTETLMGEFSDKLVLWGTPPVVKAWVAMMRLPQPAGTLETAEAYTRMLRAIRKEFGHEDIALDDVDLLRVVIVDADTFVAELESTPEGGAEPS